ncbi:MAG: Eco57I restriction-modification methylase domain-containing protein [Candidatus Kapaibacteriota bacterium]
MDKTSAKFVVQNLLEKYNQLLERDKIKRYNEEMTKKDFILPLFRALGWDTEDSNEVSAEEKISKKRVDYGFKLNGIPKFFLEAKSLRENLDKPQYVEQAISYAWHKGCTWAVLTNFASIRIFNAEWQTDSLLQSHFKTLECTDFLQHFDELWLLSKESFEQGRLDTLAERWGKKAKKIPIDKQLLVDFTQLRELLSKNITKLNQNKNISEDELDEAVQRILDRLIFIRNCEDRELEPKHLLPLLNEYSQLSSARTKGFLADRLRKVFDDFNTQYNSKIFDLHLCDSLEIDNNVLANVIERLYYSNAKTVAYDFSAIEADVLGSIYEQYLGHILKKTPTRATLTESYAHRKQQGIYYTPTNIVDYIVRCTLGDLLSKAKPKDAECFRVLDPACGSGSFLIKAFDIFYEYFSNHDRNFDQAEIDFATGLSYDRKLKILKNNIFGVDLDRQAVEIAQLNLLLKVAEKSQRLPLLQENIKCGNSLVDDPAIAGDKAFVWQDEFKEIFDAGGFDVVIGNPPYIRQERLKEFKPTFKNKFQIFNSTSDIYTYFFELAYRVLKQGGICGFITSNKFMRARYGENLRKFLKEKTTILQIIDFGGAKVFEEATVDTSIVIFKKESPPPDHKIKYRIIKENNILLNQDLDFGFIEQVKLSDNAWTLADENVLALKEKIERIGKPLKDWDVKIYRGVLTGFNEAFIIDTKTRNKVLENCQTEEERKRTEEIIKPVLRGRDIKKWRYKWAEKWVIKIEAGWTNKNRGKQNPEEFFKNTFPSLYDYFRTFKGYKGKGKGLFNRDDQGDYWWELRHCDYYPEFEKEKIVWQEIVRESSFAYDNRGFYCEATSFLMTGKNLKYILGLLNSKPVTFFFKEFYAGGGLGDEGYRYKKAFLEQVPLPPITPQNQQVAEQIERLVEQMLALNNRLSELGDKITDERARIEQEIKKTDAQIDKHIYELYNLTAEEIKIIEG